MQASRLNSHIISPNKFCPSKISQTPCNISFYSNVNKIGATSISFPDPHNLSTQNIDHNNVAFWDYQFLFTSQRLEVTNPIKLKLIEGALPKNFPSGTYYLTGPGLFTDDFGSRVHPLDGHGYVRAFQIDGPKGEVRFSAQYVKTEAQMEECDPASGSWRFTHRGPFSVLKGGKMIANTKVMKNVANTSILKWGGRLFCLWEGGIPYEIDPHTLDTVGSFNLIKDDEAKSHDQPRNEDKFHAWDVVAHLLKPILYGVFKMPPKRMLSHYKVDVPRGRLLVMTCNAEDMLVPQSHCTFYEFDVNFNVLQKRKFKIPDHLMTHDWAFTDTYYILFANRVKFDILGSLAAVSGVAPMISTLSVNHNKLTSPIYLLPRFCDVKPNAHCDESYWRKPIEVPQLWLLHVANAFEERDNHGNLSIHIHASTCAYKWFNFQKMFGYDWENDILDPSTMNYREEDLPHLVQVSIKLNGDHSKQEFSVTCLSKCNRSSDFPVINARYSGYKHRYIYVASASGSCKTLPHFPYDTIAKIDTISKNVYTWFSGNRIFVGEPIFMSTGPRGEDDGYLLVVEYVASHRRCNLVVLDAKRIGEASALLARFEVPKSLTFPLGFHGTWAPQE